MRFQSRAALLAAATILTPPAFAAAPAAKSVPIATLVKQVSIPHTMFRLPNGLTVIVHEDHKAPVVAVSTWYNVGSKDEPKGKTGFAHLFEHLMFNGTENLPGDFFTYLQNIGATDYNGTTWYDRTNYFETVPSGALDRALFMESDRMGHLLGAVTQSVLDNQRGVVQNEKRQGDSRPGGLVQYALLENLFPAGHPYHHTDDRIDGRPRRGEPGRRQAMVPRQIWPEQCGSGHRRRRDRGAGEAAGREIFRRHRARAGQQSGAGGGADALPSPKRIAMKDNVATTIVQHYWAVPGLLDRQMEALDVGASVLGGLASSRLDRIMVRDEKIAVAVTAGLEPYHRIGIFSVGATVKPGVDPKLVEKRLDEIMADYVAKGPTAGRGPARGDGRGVGPDPRARAGRRLRRQGGDARGRADLRPRQRFL